MFKNYLTVALRNIRKDSAYSIINITGLAVAFACVLMIIAYIRFELSYDTTYSHAPRIYRLITKRSENGEANLSTFSPTPLGRTLATDYPDIESFTSLDIWERDFTYKDKTLRVTSANTNSNFFHVFNFPFKYGNLASAKEPEAVAISESTAKLFFGIKNPLGEKLMIGGRTTKIVKAVFADLPVNVHFGKVDVLMTDSVSSEPLNTNAYSSDQQYILLKEGDNIALLQAKLPAFYKKYGFASSFTIGFQPVTSIHLHSDIPDDKLVNSDIRYIYLFGLIAFLILCIACINYTNLTTARSLQRMREVGVRKIMGAAKRQLVFQFLTESLLFFGVALGLALVLSDVAWPAFTRFLHLQVMNDVPLFNTQSISILLLVGVLASMLVGLYPALLLSALQPAEVLKGWKNNIPVSFGLRKVLIVFQFVVSVFLIIATIVVQLQLYHINNTNLGFNKEQLLMLDYNDADSKDCEAFKQRLLSQSNIRNVSMAGFSVGQNYGATSSMGSAVDTAKQWSFAFIDADIDFIKTMQIPILEGRGFSPAFAADRIDPWTIMDSMQSKHEQLTGDQFKQLTNTRSIIITKKLAEMIHLPKPYTGQVIHLDALQGTVVGVMDDFRGISLKQKNPAIVLRASSGVRGNTFIRIGRGDVQGTLQTIETLWKQYFPQQTFRFSFVDEQVQKMYDSEQRLASFFSIFASLGIGIACLGLFSLVALLIQQKTKEIGIRKVLGAGVKNIVQLVSAGFIKPVIISLFIASPVAWVVMNKWLQGYESRIEISWWIFALAGTIAVTIAMITISIQTIKTATANPVKSLRTE